MGLPIDMDGKECENSWLRQKVKKKIYLSHGWWCVPEISSLRSLSWGTGASLRPARATESVPGQLGLYNEILYQVEEKATKDFWFSVS